MSKILVTTIFLWILLGQKLFSATAPQAPDVKEWSEEWQGKIAASAVLPSQITIVGDIVENSSTKRTIKEVGLKSENCEKLSFIKCVESRNFMYALKLNQVSDALTDDELMNVSLSGLLVYNQGKNFVISGGKKFKAVTIPNGPKIKENSSLRALLDRMLTSLGYDGIVLDVRGDFLLVGSLDARIAKKDLQGLLIKDSENKMTVDGEGSKEGGALITLLGRYRGYGVFKSIITLDNVKVGQKVLIEKSSR